ncbi:uncharacterized protein TM35_000081790 [Trypanosoma theileri]|uniref:Uncharacterized protein n=1 Tax=Trypanosoma theileri TaxID=67003 RepID=A0A1X0P0L4_9TRYP|nr:uncharacterized protein TM35_000081790 [Trypanosoma theileri]ORC90381.1 hypothetical protein TM35_000081790 [Trypanosoma theileri]
MNNTILVCTECGKPNNFPMQHINMQQRENMTTFCNTCGTVTLQRVQNISDQTEQQREVNEHTTGTTTPSSINPSITAPLLDVNEQLWKRLQETLVNNGISMADFFRCDVPTKLRIISSMGFNKSEMPKLMELAEVKHPRNSLNTPPQSMKQEVEISADGSNRSGFVPSNSNGRVSSNLTNPKISTEQMVETPHHKMHNENSLLGLTVKENGTLLAYCSVYPNLPAEFWCSLCGALVSSRCHVTGIHKDHPFITLRQAAEAHVGDLKTWSERCRSQLNVASNIVANLKHGKELISETVKDQEKELDQQFEEIIRGLTQWREELRSSLRLQVDAQIRNIDLALENTTDLMECFTERQNSCDPLLQNIPPIHQNDKQSEDWSLRVMNLVSQLKATRYEPIPMPRLTVPEVKSFATAATYMDLIKAVSVPAAVRLPDVLDMGYLNFPNPSDVSREAFTLQPPADAVERGILIYSGRTLTRAATVTPVHVLVCSSRVFYTGLTAWAVHVDRVGAGPGRVLAGVLMAGSDGEGVVWDGQRIVGPNEGECRLLPERCRLQTGTTLRFVLELEAPSYFLICYYEEEVVARIPLPPALSGWIPAFSVFGPQDQITVVPTSTTVAEHLLSNATPDRRRKKGDGGRTEDTKVRLVEQEQKLNALQQQILAVNSRINQEQYEKFVNSSKGSGRQDKNNGKNQTNETNVRSPSSFNPTMSLFSPDERNTSKQSAFAVSHDTKGASLPPRPSPSSSLSPFRSNVSGEQQTKPETRNQRYSPELQNLMSFVESIK